MFYKWKFFRAGVSMCDECTWEGIENDKDRTCIVCNDPIKTGEEATLLTAIDEFRANMARNTAYTKSAELSCLTPEEA